MKMNMIHSSINSSTVMYGVFGDPVRHSKSPIMLNRAFQEVGLNAAYAAFHVPPKSLKDAVYGIKALNFRGINVTIPHKVEVMKYLDVIDDSARAIGAVNTIVNDNGRLIGYNTDGIGYVRSLKEETNFSIEGKRILVLGAGGAARGIVYALAKANPSKIWIANRTIDKAVELAAALESAVDCYGMGLDEIKAVMNQVDLVVNTTSTGMHPNIDEVPMNPAFLHPGLIVSDLVYNPLITKWLGLAKERGARVHSGLGMFIYQGAYAFEYWTGLAAPTAAMREVVEQSFAGGV
ncbi:MAG TPA: shikimate dehydrogenase [Bacilli bacterium]